jgi:hypothetical protein
MKSSAPKVIVPIICLFSFTMAILIAIKALLLYFEKSFSGVFDNIDDDFLDEKNEDIEIEIINGDYDYAPRVSSKND